ncbi:MAG: pyridoxal phosphate-dependent aminotransferase [Candidatus Woesearchaeota archaeon]
MDLNKITSPSFFIGKNSKDIISFGSGQPDLPPPKEIELITCNSSDFKYGLVQGEEWLRDALSNQYNLTKKYTNSTKDSFVITNGASEALDLTFRVLSNKEKKRNVLVPKPYYYSYPFTINFSGLNPLYTELKNGKIDFTDLEKKIDSCCAVLINSPSNPTGRVENIETLKKIENITNKKKITVISDEVYKDLIYERENYFIKGPKVVTINSFSKTYSMCGDRIGYLWSNDDELVRKVIEMKTHTSMNTNIKAQKRAFLATKIPKEYIENQRKIWEKRRNLIYNGLNEIGFELNKPEGAFYVLPKVKNSNKVIHDLYFDHNVVVYRGEWFGANNHIRLSYALDECKIKKGLKIINSYVKKNKIL